MRRQRFTIRAPSRLHFGLLAPTDHRRQFGGLGAMLAAPGLQVEIEPSPRFTLDGQLVSRTAELVERWCRHHHLPSPPRCRLEVRTAAPIHCGLGVGTQLALSVATALHAFTAQPCGSAEELATGAGRGSRSAIGSHGFWHGGFLFERGKAAGELLAPLTRRVPLPDSWRFVLMRPTDAAGLCGQRERDAFARLPSVPPAVGSRMLQLVDTELMPAAGAAEVVRFGEALYEYGQLAGMCFAAIQGGPYHGPHVTRLVDDVRQLGVPGVAQSSWGPTVAAVVASPSAAARLVGELSDRHSATQVEMRIARPNNCGAWMVLDPGSAEAGMRVAESPRGGAVHSILPELTSTCCPNSE